MYIIENYFTSTKTYNTEHTEIILDGETVSHSRYKWLNRPWQKYKYASSLSMALKKYFHYKEDKEMLDNLLKLVEDSYSIETAVRLIEEVLNEKEKK